MSLIRHAMRRLATGDGNTGGDNKGGDNKGGDNKGGDNKGRSVVTLDGGPALFIGVLIDRELAVGVLIDRELAGA